MTFIKKDRRQILGEKL